MTKKETKTLDYDSVLAVVLSIDEDIEAILDDAPSRIRSALRNVQGAITHVRLNLKTEEALKR